MKIQCRRTTRRPLVNLIIQKKNIVKIYSPIIPASLPSGLIYVVEFESI